MGASCAIFPCVKGKTDKQGNHPISRFFKRANKLFGRDTAKAMYATINSKDFLEKYSDRLSYDENGEPTIESYLKVMGETVASRKLLENVNKEYDEGTYSYKEAEAKVNEFNHSHQYDDDNNPYMATMVRTYDGKYHFFIAAKSPLTRANLVETIADQKILELIVNRLSELGVDVSFVTDPHEKSRYSTVNARKTAEGLWALVQLVNGKDVAAHSAEEAGHFALAAFKDNKIAQRLETLLQDENLQKAIIEKYGLQKEDLGANPARELAGKLIGIVLRDTLNEKVRKEMGEDVEQETLNDETQSGWKRLATRFVNNVKTFFHRAKTRLTGEDLTRDIRKADRLAEIIADGFLTDLDSMDVEQALETEETLYSRNLNEIINETLRDVDDDNSEAVQDAYTMVKYLGALGEKLEGLYKRGNTAQMSSIERESIKRNAKSVSEAAAKRLKDFDEHNIKDENQALEIVRDLVDIANKLMKGSLKAYDDMKANLDIYTNDLFAVQITTYSSLTLSLIETSRCIKSLMLVAKQYSSMLNNATNEELQSIETYNTTLHTRCSDILNKLNFLYTQDMTGAKSIMIAPQRLAKKQEKFYDALMHMYMKENAIWNEGKTNAKGKWHIEGEYEKLVKKGERLNKNGERRGNVYKTVFAREIDGKTERRVFVKTDYGYYTDSTEVPVSLFLDNLFCDQSIWSAYFGSAANAEEITQIVAKAYRYTKQDCDNKVYKIWERLVELRKKVRKETGFLHSDYRWMYEKDETGKLTGNLVTEFDWGAYDRDFDAFKNKCKESFKKTYATMVEDFRNGKITESTLSLYWANFFKKPFSQWVKDNRKDYGENEDSIYGTTWHPSEKKYHSAQWEKLTEGQKELMKEYLEIKRELDSYLPDGYSHTYRAPQFRASFVSMTQNMKMAHEGWVGSRIGHALRIKLADTFFATQWESEFGSDNTADVDDKLFESKRSLYITQQQEVKNIPLYGIRRLDDMNTLSVDIFGSTLSYAAMAINYGGMAQNIDIWESIKDQSYTRKINQMQSEGGASLINQIVSAGEKKLGIRKSADTSHSYMETEENLNKDSLNTRAYTRLSHLLDRQVYGRDGWVAMRKSHFKQFCYKFTMGLQHFASKWILGGNVWGGMVNTFTGYNELVKEGQVEQFFTLEDLHYAERKYAASVIPNLFGLGVKAGGMGADRKVDFISSFIHKFDVLNENRYAFAQWSTEGGLMRRGLRRVTRGMNKSIMYPYHSGDHFMQCMTYLSLGHHIKVYDYHGKEYNLIDTYRADGYGNLRQIKSGTFSVYWYKEENGATLDAKLKGAIGSLESERNHNVNIDVIIPLLKKYTDITEKQYEDASIAEKIEMIKTLQDSIRWGESDEMHFAAKARELGNRMHGIYNFTDQTAAHNYLLGRSLLQMRGWLLGMLDRRLGERRYNFALGQTTEGSWITMLKLLGNTVWGPTITIDRKAERENGMNAFVGEEYDDNTIISDTTRWKLFGNTLMALLYPFKKSTQEKLYARGFDDYQVANIKRSWADGFRLFKLMMFGQLNKLLLLTFYPSEWGRRKFYLELMRKKGIIDESKMTELMNKDKLNKNESVEFAQYLEQISQEGISIMEDSFWWEYITNGGAWEDFTINPLKWHESFDIDSLIKRTDQTRNLWSGLLSAAYYINTRAIAEQAIFVPASWPIFPLGFHEMKNAIGAMAPILFSFVTSMAEGVGLLKDMIIQGPTNLDPNDPDLRKRFQRMHIPILNWDYNVYAWDYRTHQYELDQMTTIWYKYKNFEAALKRRYKYSTVDDNMVENLFNMTSDDFLDDNNQKIYSKINAIDLQKSVWYGFGMVEEANYIPGVYENANELINNKLIAARIVIGKLNLDYLNKNTWNVKSPNSYMNDMGISDELKNSFYVKDNDDYQRAANARFWTWLWKHIYYTPLFTRMMYGMEIGMLNQTKFYEWMLGQPL